MKSSLFVCPFHQQGKHSHNAVVYFNNGGWQCFNSGCGSSGFLTTIVQRMEKCSYKKAIRICEKKFKLDLDKIIFEEPDISYDVKIFSLPKFFIPINSKNPYLKKHNFKWGTLNRLGIGEMKHDESKLILPYTMNGLNVGYAIKPDDQRANFPEGFAVNNYLYGFDNAKIYDEVYIVEGQRDVWRLWEFNIPGVCLNNANCSSKQLSLIVKNWGKVILCLDGDSAGLDGNIVLFNKLNGLLDVSVKLMPWNKDPNDCTKEEFLNACVTNNLRIIINYNKL